MRVPLPSEGVRASSAHSGLGVTIFRWGGLSHPRPAALSSWPLTPLSPPWPLRGRGSHKALA